MYYTEHKLKEKNGGGLGMRLLSTYLNDSNQESFLVFFVHSTTD